MEQPAAEPETARAPRNMIHRERVSGNTLVIEYFEEGHEPDPADDVPDEDFEAYAGTRGELEELLRDLFDEALEILDRLPDGPLETHRLVQQRHVGARIVPSPADAPDWVPEPFPWERVEAAPAPDTIPMADPVELPTEPAVPSPSGVPAIPKAA